MIGGDGMATFQQNIDNIRGEAIYGPDIRESIAEAIEQAVGIDVGLHIRLAQIEDDNYMMVVSESTQST